MAIASSTSSSTAASSSISINSVDFSNLAELTRIENASFADPWSALSLEAALGDAKTIVLAIREDGIMLGFGVAWVVLDEGEITHLVIEPHARRRGLGKVLLEALRAECARRGARRLFLEVRRSNESAQRLYERAGFIAAGWRRAYYNDGEDALLMQWG